MDGGQLLPHLPLPVLRGADAPGRPGGLVVIDEVPAVGMCFWQSKPVFDGSRVNEKTLEHHLDTLRDLYARDKNHPCVVMWSVANEADTSEDGRCRTSKR